MANAYFCYVLAFAVALGAYSLGWSSLYPELSIGLFSFLGITIVIHAISGTLVARKKPIQFTPVVVSDKAAILTTLFLFILWTFDFLHEGGIPLLKILTNRPYNYRLFGIPTLHVFIVTFSSFFTVFLFHCYLSSRKKVILLLYVINLSAAILIYNRGMLMFNLASSLLVFLFALKRKSWTILALIPVSGLVLLYLFGVLGTLRVSREAKTPYDNRHFMLIGDPTESFTNSSIPKEYFWSYIYVTSPLANLQYNIDTHSPEPVTIKRVAEMANNEIVMDFISKRVNSLMQLEPEKPKTLPERPFNVSTVYAGAYTYLGWSGMIIMALIILAIPLIYLRILPSNSPFHLTGLAILNTVFLFFPFDNTLRFTGLSFQLVYPIALHYSPILWGKIRRQLVNNKVTSV